jgi:hypothetical protein
VDFGDDGGFHDGLPDWRSRMRNVLKCKSKAVPRPAE